MSIAEHNKITEDKSFITHRYNQWDQNSLDKKVNEIIKIESEEKNIKALLKSYSQHCVENDVYISIVRIKEGDRQKRRALEQEGFRMKEVAYNICTSKKKLASSRLYNSMRNRLKTSENELTSSCSEEDLLALTDRMFNHGRFVEDLAIEPHLSHKRNNQWALTLLRGGCEKIFLKKKKRLVAFMFYEQSPAKAVLHLAGVSDKYPHLVPSFWTYVLSCLDDDAKINTCISAANVGVLNLYTSLGFKVTEALIGYHKFYNNEKPL